jgi:2-methylisocitrate lyase-like PEP mutase family enzyme
MPISIADRRTTFARLHQSGTFVIPNPWDAGSARYLQHLGFSALASTSAGVAFSDGLPDGAVSRDRILAHLAELVRATDVPVNADFQAGYATDARGVADSVRLCVETGVAGLSIEDSTGDAKQPLYDLATAVDRLKAARAAIGTSGVLLTGRAECFLVGHADPLNEAIRRLRAYSEAGADVLYAPGLRGAADIEAVVKAVAPKPVNVLRSTGSAFTVAQLAELGVRRVSVGSALASVAWGAFASAARELAASGTFGGFKGAMPFAELEAFFRKAPPEN